MRLVLVMGKGGVGKTTLSAATALAATERHRRVLLVSTDAAHSLADALDCQLGGDPGAVTPGVDAVQLDGRHELERSWTAIAGYARELLGVAELGRLHADELLVVPGLDQLLALARLRALVASGDWDAIVVDCAPSADSLRLLSLPDVLDWYAGRLFGRHGAIRSRLRRTLERTLAVAAPSDQVLASVADLSHALADLRRVLGAADTSVRLVVTPERLVIAEAQRTLSYLALYGFAADAVLINRVIDSREVVPVLTAWHASQARQLEYIHDAFGPLPRFVCNLRPAEPIGVAELLGVGRELYDGVDPLARLSEQEAMDLRVVGDRAVLRLPVRGVGRAEIGLQRRDMELVVTLGSYRRAVVLPDGLRQREVVRAGVVDGTLEVEFAETVDARS